MAELDAYERRFRRAGLPLFIEDYSAREVARGQRGRGAQRARDPARRLRPREPAARAAVLVAAGRPPLDLRRPAGQRGRQRAAAGAGLRGDPLRPAGHRPLERAVPLLLVFALVLVINTEMWQVFSDMPDAFLALVGVLFVVTGSAFVAAQLPREVRELTREMADSFAARSEYLKVRGA